MRFTCFRKPPSLRGVLRCWPKPVRSSASRSRTNAVGLSSNEKFLGYVALCHRHCAVSERSRHGESWRYLNLR
jgi:hypothetical protein